MTEIEAFERSLEVVVEACGDPVKHVYSQVYKQYPEVQDLFILDTDHGARGHMLNEALNCAQDLLTDDVFATTFIASERLNHQGYDVTNDVFESFYAIVLNVFREAAGQAWTAEMEQAWQTVLARVSDAKL